MSQSLLESGATDPQRQGAALNRIHNWATNYGDARNSTARTATSQKRPSRHSLPALCQRRTIIATMLRGTKNPSDLIFSPGRAPQVEVGGQLVQLKIQGVGMLMPEDTARIASDLIGHNQQALDKLKEQGSCDISYSLAKLSRFRVNIFTQRGSCAIVMRVIPTSVPTFAQLNLPQQLADSADLRNGIVLVTGPTGSGKSSTLAAILDKINEEKAYHVITIEDPIEFLHAHKRATIHQRELHSRTRQVSRSLCALPYGDKRPKVILVGEMRDKETIEVALEAAETGHLVFSTLHTTDASKTIERIIGVFALGEAQRRHPQSPRKIVPLHHFAPPDAYEKTAPAAWPSSKYLNPPCERAST